MKVINTGDVYRLYGDDVKTFDNLPARVYMVNFSKMSGFYLTNADDIEVGEKIYGVHIEKVEKVMGSFAAFERNLGVILSGPKGIGKSLFAKLLSIEAVKRGYPVVIVNTYYPGIADYLASIQQETLVLFDEYDKTFLSKDGRGTECDPQTEMLTLFDGMAQGKKLFAITCNELRNLSDYLVNRPGRFHYHFRFDYPNSAEVREYLSDKIPEAAGAEIDKVIAFSGKVDLNYDCLRAIAFELSNGRTFEQAIEDLNIINLNRELYTVEARFKGGLIVRGNDGFDMFSGEECQVELKDPDGYDFYINFDGSSTVYDYSFNAHIIPGENVRVDWEDDYYGKNDKERAKLEARKTRVLDCVIIRRKPMKKLHYTI